MRPLEPSRSLRETAFNVDVRMLGSRVKILVALEFRFCSTTFRTKCWKESGKNMM